MKYRIRSYLVYNGVVFRVEKSSLFGWQGIKGFTSLEDAELFLKNALKIHPYEKVYNEG